MSHICIYIPTLSTVEAQACHTVKLEWSWNQKRSHSLSPLGKGYHFLLFSRWIWLLLFDEQCVKALFFLSSIVFCCWFVNSFVFCMIFQDALNQMYCQYFISLWAFQFLCVHMWLAFICSYVICVEMAFIWQWTKRSISSIFSRDSPIQPTGWKAGLAWSLPQSLVLPLHCAQESDYAKAVEASISCGGIWSQNLWWFGQTSTSKELETLILKANGNLGKRKPCVHPVN